MQIANTTLRDNWVGFDNLIILVVCLTEDRITVCSLLSAKCHALACSPALLTTEQLQGGCCARARPRQQQAAAGWAQLRPAPRCRARRGQNQSQLTGGGQARAAHAAADQSTTTQTSHLAPGCRLAATLSCTLGSVHCVQQCSVMHITTINCAQCTLLKHK